jgi:hypothetical protein
LSIFGTKITNRQLIEVKGEIKHALIACQKGFNKGDDVRRNHGNEFISERDAEIAREYELHAKKDLAIELHRIATDLEK